MHAPISVDLRIVAYITIIRKFILQLTDSAKLTNLYVCLQSRKSDLYPPVLIKWRVGRGGGLVHKTMCVGATFSRMYINYVRIYTICSLNSINIHTVHCS